MRAAGPVRVTGSPQTLMTAATGQIWEIQLPQDKVPPPDWRAARSVRDAAGTRVRVVGAPPCAAAQPATPTLEEAYLALMGQPSSPTASAR